MAITRKLLDISVSRDVMGGTDALVVRSSALIRDDVENTESPWHKQWNAPRVQAAAAELRDAIMEQSAQQGRPMI